MFSRQRFCRYNPKIHSRAGLVFRFIPPTPLRVDQWVFSEYLDKEQINSGDRDADDEFEGELIGVRWDGGDKIMFIDTHGLDEFQKRLIESVKAGVTVDDFFADNDCAELQTLSLADACGW